MAEIVPIVVHADGFRWKVRLIFRSRFWRVPILSWLLMRNVGAVTLSARTVRFKRDRGKLPLWLVGRELVHCRQARRLNWRYLPKYLWDGVKALLRRRTHPMELAADLLRQRWTFDDGPRSWEASARPIPFVWRN